MTEQIPFQKIMVPLDGSRWAEKAIPHAEQIARGGGELMLVHIYQRAGSEFLSDAVIAGQTSHLDEARRRAEEYVKGLRSRISSQNLKVSAHVLEGGNAAQRICQFVNDEDIDVVVMPSASHHNLARILLGDLTSRVGGCVNACLLLVRGSLAAEWDAESRKTLIERGEAAGTPQPAESAGKGVPDTASLLDHLIALRDAGVLSVEEFEAKSDEVQKRQDSSDR
ncbi:MAG: universal stress protein [Chloroflexi bacterium]|nr:universal stress protein [Chloroflexota bacterium]